MEEFISLSSSTPRPTMGYDNYLTLLQNAFIRYDSTHMSKPSPVSRAAYQHELSPDQHDNPYPQDYSSSGTSYGAIDMPDVEFYQVHTTNLNSLLLSPQLLLGSLPLPLLQADPTPEGPLAPSSFLPTFTNS